jgi:methionyl-tRNA synthetase
MKYITTPIYYANDAPHIGHAVTTVAADVLNRYWKLKGEETFLLTGTDEHGAKMSEAAAKANVAPQAFVDSIAPQFTQAWIDLNIEIDGFVRTSDPKHEAIVAEFLTNLYNKGEIYQGSYKGWYCVGCEEFKTETQIGPDYTCPIHKRPLIELEEEAYLFRLSNYRQQLTDLIVSGQLKIQPESRKNEVLGFLEHEALRDIAISRKSVQWGIPVPWDRNHTVYVWIDALLAYYSSTQPSGPDFASNKKAVWPPYLHLIGKDILRFHAIIWPAMLLAAEKELPQELFVHGYFTVDGQKMSKSLGNVITPQQLIERYGVDGTRYLLLAAIPFGSDGDISLKRLDELYTSDLANNLGNVISRVQSMLERYREGQVPIAESTDVDGTFFVEIDYLGNVIGRDRELTTALASLQGVIDNVNLFIEDEKPWELAKEGRNNELNVVLGLLAEAIYVIGALFAPFLPTASEKILSIFGTSIGQINYATLLKQNHTAGKKIMPIPPLFPRLV